MNHIYRTVFNRSINQYQVASELCKSPFKKRSALKKIMLATALAGISHTSLATPVPAGDITVSSLTPAPFRSVDSYQVVHRDSNDISNSIITVDSNSQSLPLSLVLTQDLVFDGQIINSPKGGSLQLFSDILGAPYARIMTINNALPQGNYEVHLNQDFTLKAGAANVFSADSVHFIGANSAVDLGGFDQTIAGLTSHNQKELNETNRLEVRGNTLTIEQLVGHVYRGAINSDSSGKISLTSSNGQIHTQQFFGNNSGFTGTIQADHSTAEFGSGLLGASEITLSNSATVRFSSSASESTFPGGTTFNGHITSTTAERIFISDNSTLNFGGTVDQHGYTEIGINGTLKIISADARLSANSPYALKAGSTLDLNNFDISVGSLHSPSTGNASNVKLGSGTLTFGAADQTLPPPGQTAEFSGIISGTGGITKVGNTTHTISGANTYSGLTTVSAGTLRAGASNTFAQQSQFAVSSGATLHLNNYDQTIKSLSGAGTVSLGTATLTFEHTDAAAPTDFSGAITGTGNLIKNGIGSLTLSGTNTYSGSATVNDGMLILSGLNNSVSSTQIDGGTLQIGSGGTTGKLGNDATSVVHALTNNGTLAFNRSDNIRLDTVITGTGELIQRGSGTLTVTSNNLYDGTTTVESGTLQLGNNGTTGSINGDLAIASGATANFNRSDDQSFSGAISGSGNLVKSAANKLTLATDHSFNGTTTVSQGTLQIGDGGTTGSLLSNIINNAELVFNRSNDLTYAQIISGSGNLEQAGSGNLILTANHDYTGDTTITSGSLQLGNGGTSGSVLGNIINNGSLIINRSDDLVFSNALTGSGQLIKQGSNTLTIENNPVAAGGTQQQQGKLIIGSSAGSSASLSSDLTALSGSTLAGHGILDGTLTLAGGATLSPGNSIGTFTINGNTVFNSGSIVEMEVDPSGLHDRILINGNLDLGGSTLQVIALPGTWGNTMEYKIIEANAVTGTFATTLSNFAFLTPQTIINPADVTLRLTRNNVGFDQVALTPNQNAVANALSSNSTGQIATLVTGMSAEQARQTFDNLSGEIYSSTRNLLLEDSRHLREAMGNRLYSQQHGYNEGGLQQSEIGNGIGLWSKAYGSSGRKNGGHDYSILDASSSGLMAGLDLPLNDTWRAGVSASFSQNKTKVNALSSKADIKSTSVGAYIGGQVESISLRAGTSYSWHDIDSRRTVNYGAAPERNRATYKAQSAQLFTEVGYPIQFEHARLEPFMGLTHVAIKQQNIHERGGISALRTEGGTTQMTYASLGARGLTRLGEPGGMPLDLQASLAYQHAISRPENRSTHQMAEYDAFKIAGIPIDRDSAVAQLGLNLAVSETTNLNLNYSGQHGSNYKDHGVRLGIDIAF